MDGMVARRAPPHRPPLRTMHSGWQFDSFLAQTQDQLAHAADLSKLSEHQRQRFADTLVRVLFQPVIGAAPIADGDRRVQIAARRLQAQSLLRALPQRRQFELAESAFHAEQQAIVYEPRIVDSVLIDDQAADQGAELQKGVPIAPVAGQARGLESEDRACIAAADSNEQALEAWARCPAPRAAEIVVDDNNVLPAELAGPCRQRVLASSALRIVQELIHAGLPHIDVGAARQMIPGDLTHRPSPSAF